jgi:hypothetical protein
LPLLISALPLFGINLLNNIYFESGMILIALIIGSTTLWHGYKRHHHRMIPLLSFLSGMALLILNHFIEDYKLLLVIPSSILIILAYFLNWRFCRQAKHCHSSDCNH